MPELDELAEPAYVPGLVLAFGRVHGPELVHGPEPELGSELGRELVVASDRWACPS